MLVVFIIPGSTIQVVALIDKSATILAGGLIREILYDRRNQDNTVETGMVTAKSDSCSYLGSVRTAPKKSLGGRTSRTVAALKDAAPN